MKLDLDFSDALAGETKEEEDTPADDKPIAQHPKTEARLMAVQAVYQHLLLATSAEGILKTFNPAYLKKREAHTGLFTTLFNATITEKERYQTLITPLLSAAWPWDRLGYVEQAILLCATAELDVCPQTPPKVILNEFLIIAHSYFEPKDVSFINGVLDKTLGLLRG